VGVCVRVCVRACVYVCGGGGKEEREGGGAESELSRRLSHVSVSGVRLANGANPKPKPNERLPSGGVTP
jgi:hypothetical protein